ncbi:uncharacterized protein JN550_003929 [Neoarthrinium moseri]|uniref:uncharacterized protein n=1 Tax=Neoarthrinium moseri TaxID=1658444 RepID=UPI001FDD8A05|nr:uncharacterized protein JN550_003929 [Neoarthrinium moseri]KAI1872210.1 hypothetical protein JN550_003929 [Neoarthrinium moseri]
MVLRSFDSHGLTHSGRARPASMQRQFVLNPITALEFFTSSHDGRVYVLAGEDNRLKIYDVESSALCGELEVFPAQSIHGIRVAAGAPARRRILIWGGYSVTVLLAEAVESRISGDVDCTAPKSAVVEAKAPDWIFEGALSPYGTDDLVLLTAHNELIEARFHEEQGSLDFAGIHSPSRPILYSGNLLWEAPDSILVAAGTVFGEIVVWKYHAGSTGDGPGCEILFVFSGHEGSIFGVHISPIFQLETGESLRLLASCSDDRTIRIWDITDARDLSRSTHDEYSRKILAARQTGFGDSIDSTLQENTSARCLAVAMGHISRIWQVQFRIEKDCKEASSNIELWSFGEDATAQRWSLSLGATQSPASDATTHKKAMNEVPTRTGGQLKNQGSYASHSGKNLWSHAITRNDSRQLLILTGGSDGNISIIGNGQMPSTERILDDIPPAPIEAKREHDATHLTGLASIEENSNTQSPILHGDDAAIAEDEIPQSKPKTKTKKPKVKKFKDFFNRYAFLADGRLLAVTKAGRFFIGGSDSEPSWSELSLPETFSGTSFSYAVVSSSPSASAAFVGTAEGHILAYQTSDSLGLRYLAKVHGKVSDIFLLSNPPAEEPATNTNKATGGLDARTSGGTLSLLVTVLGSESAAIIRLNSSGDAIETKETAVHLEKGFVATSAALAADTLILGSRNGIISILQPSGDGSFEPRCSVKNQVKDCITSINVLPPKPGGSANAFLATSRDGKYRIYNIQRDEETVEALLVHETSPPFGPMIEGARFNTNRNGSIDLILYGFRSTKFVVWNEAQRREVAAVDCGGGHRTYAFSPLPGHPDGFRLAWTQASQLFFFSQTHAAHGILKSGGHGRELKAISASGDFVATAAEDTAIRLWNYDSHQERLGKALQCLAVMENHTAGIQSMKWYRQSHLFSSAGNKEFFVWRISHLESAYQGLAVKCEAAYPDRTEDIDLRIMDFDVHCLNEDKLDSGDPTFFISMALSNSTLLTYTYSEKSGFALIARGTYTGACMTQLRFIHVDGAAIQTLTAATDGHITLWETKLSPLSQEAETTRTSVSRLHQSTIKSLDLRRARAAADPASRAPSCLVATGGDDDALGVMHLAWDEAAGRYTVASKAVVRSAHAAAVTGLAILDAAAGGDDDDDDAVVVTSSNDQRVRRWRVAGWRARGQQRPRVALLDNRYSSIADAGDLEALGGGRFAVGGVGLEVWHVGGEAQKAGGLITMRKDVMTSQTRDG